MNENDFEEIINKRFPGGVIGPAPEKDLRWIVIIFKKTDEVYFSQAQEAHRFKTKNDAEYFSDYFEKKFPGWSTWITNNEKPGNCI